MLTPTEKGYFITDAVRLSGYQAILKPSKFGYSLSALFPESYEEALAEDRENSIKWAESKLKNPKRAVQKPEPWEPSTDNPGYLKVKFSWNEEYKPTVLDSDNVAIEDDGIPLFSDAVVRLIFKQKPYILKDGVTYGTSLKVSAIQVLALNKPGVGTDTGDLKPEELADMFRTADTHGLDAAEAQQARDAAVEQDPEAEF
jgi:hypothetical protein